MEQTSYWLLRCSNQLLTTAGSVFPRGSAAEVGNPEAPLYIGEWQGLPCYAAEVVAPVGGEPQSLHRIFRQAGEEAFVLAGRATQLLDWRKNHRYCGNCGSPTGAKPDEFAMACPACGLLAYPRLSPAIMVLVRRGADILLARGPQFPPDMYSALAGFVEPGESAEQCAVREVREEVGIAIANLRYFGSQPWPFPNSLMLAFFADYAGGEITPDANEIEAAAWFSRDALPRLPDAISIARRLIDAAWA